MVPRIASVVKKVAMGLAIVLVVFLAARVYESQRGPALHVWHTWTGQEMTAAAIDDATFDEYLQQEAAIFHDLERNVSETASDDAGVYNRYDPQSPVYPGHFDTNWNRSFVLMPTGQPRGAAVLLHGLTDSPYSMRALAEEYQRQGFVAVVIRMPGHGTAPGALTDVDWEAWLAATRLAVREATRLTGPQLPLELVGYSNGGALAMKYTLDSLQDKSLRRPQQVVLLSPMIGVTAFARFAGLAGLPAVFPAFAKAAWLNVVPEFNPFKYNSFPVNAARQSYLLTKSLQQQILQASRDHLLGNLPPVLTFQSVMDSTVSARAVVESLYRYLPDNGSELVIFDINQAAGYRPLFKPQVYSAVASLLPPPPRQYSTTVVTNADDTTSDVVALTIPAGELTETTEPLGLRWPQDMYSLSHVAVPFPMNDALYGGEPEAKNRYGISIGTMSLRGETSVLIVGLDGLMRATANPFYPWMVQQIQRHLP
jgi:alpha-beta hydrolase superfamily lysophospholipase